VALEDPLHRADAAAALHACASGPQRAGWGRRARKPAPLPARGEAWIPAPLYLPFVPPAQTPWPLTRHVQDENRLDLSSPGLADLRRRKLPEHGLRPGAADAAVPRAPGPASSATAATAAAAASAAAAAAIEGAEAGADAERRAQAAPQAGRRAAARAVRRDVPAAQQRMQARRRSGARGRRAARCRRAARRAAAVRRPLSPVAFDGCIRPNRDAPRGQARPRPGAWDAGTHGRRHPAAPAPADHGTRSQRGTRPRATPMRPARAGGEGRSWVGGVGGTWMGVMWGWFV
jgi:hypothetical protein